MEPDFSGYVSKANLRCADGRVIMPGAFKHQDGTKVPLVYQHAHDDINQVLGYTELSDRPDGVWGDVFLNKKTNQGQNAGMMVAHGDLDKFSIWAKDLDERGFEVHKGTIQEVSLVLAGSNPGANVQNVLMHDGFHDDELMVVGFEIEHSNLDEEDSDSGKELTVGEVLDTLNEDQKLAIGAVLEDAIAEAKKEASADSSDNENEVTHDNLSDNEDEVTHDNLSENPKGTNMSRNVFDKSKDSGNTRPELKHSDVKALIQTADTTKANSLRDLVRSSEGKELMHADTYGVDNIEILFPDAQALMSSPVFVDRRQEWVKKFMAGTNKSPFSRIKTTHADITADEARAKGYIKAGQKTEEVFPVFKRTTGPVMVYKKQKLDRQDIIDIVDFDVVAWMKAEMRGKLDEEIARAGLFGDGRPAMVGGNLNPDKIQDPGGASTSGDGIRSILNDNSLYTSTYTVTMSATPSADDWNGFIDTVTEKHEYYMGSGNLTGFMSFRTAAKLLTIRDSFGHRIYKSLSELAGEMGLSEIVRVPTELFANDLLAIVVDLGDYNFGADRGGEVTLFDDFDIDFNQYKYLIEAYLSGALTLPYSAQVYRSTNASGSVVTPTAPTVNANVVTIPVQPGVVYKNVDTDATLSHGSTVTLTAIDSELDVIATPASSYSFPGGATTTWSFVYHAG